MDLRSRLSAMIAVRIVVSTLLLGSAILVHLNRPGVFPVDPFFFLIGLTFALSVIGVATLRLANRHPWIADAHLGVDALLVTGFIGLTGGIVSSFSSLYCLPIIAAGTIRFRRGALQVAVLTALLYLGLVSAQYLDLFPYWLGGRAFTLPTQQFAQFTMAINLFGFMAVAVLSGSLAERLRSADASLKAVSHQIEDLRAFNEHVIDGLPSGLLTTDADGRVLTFNRAAATLPESLLSRRSARRPSFLQLPPDIRARLTGLARTRSLGTDMEYRTAEGRVLDIGLTVTMIALPDGRSGYLHMFRDMTDVNRLERDSRRQQRLAAMGEMAAGIAHEIRNPLASMSGSIQVLRQELPLNEDQAQLMDIVLRESDRLNDTIQSFLAYARPEQFSVARLDLGKVVQDAARLLRNSPEASDAHVIDIEIPAQPVWFEADEHQMRQIVWNIASNGLRAMPEGGRLLLSVETDGAAANEVVLSVQDDGRGISEGERDSMFQPFHGSFEGGTGLGLAIVHRIVSDCDGVIEVSSTVGVGTIVRVRLPIRTTSTTAVDAVPRRGIARKTKARRPVTPDPALRLTPAKPRILVVDDEPSMRDMLRIVLRRDGYDVVVATNGTEAIERLQAEPFDLLLSDIRLPDISGVDVLRAAKQVNHEIVAFMMTAFASTDTAVEAMRFGALDYLTKPFSMDELRLKIRQRLETSRLKQENLLLKRALNSRHEWSGILGRSDAMQVVFSMIEMVANMSSTVLVSGESGTGKELVARAIHFNSLRRDRPFVAVNCGAVPETLLESELFGHMRGAFTDAHTIKKGLMEVAEGGTIFLDEVGEMATSMQVKLLRVLQDRRFRRLGGTDEIQADVRVIAATNHDLSKLVADGRFREDLFFRINVLPIQVPPLRDRVEDIPLLAELFLAQFASQMGKGVRTISASAMELLRSHPWRGNVRELQNAMERAVALERTEAILPESLPAAVRLGQSGSVPEVSGLPALGEGFDLEARGDAFYRHYLSLALERAGGVQVKAAELLGMSFRSFRYYAKKYKLR